MRIWGLGQCLFAVAMMGLGVLSLVFHSFTLQWQPMPAWAPVWLTYVSGAVLLIGGIGLWFRSTAGIAALVLMVDLLLWVLLLQLPADVPNWAHIGTWLGLCEDMGMMCGAWFLLIALNDGRLKLGPLGGATGAQIARLLFGVACVVYGLSHFAYADFTSQMIPSWLPFRLPLAYVTGAGHVAAGLALLSGVLARLAATLEAIMMSLFVVLVHIPMVAGGPKPADLQLDWTLLCVAMALAGSAWACAQTLGDRPWGFKNAES